MKNKNRWLSPTLLCLFMIFTFQFNSNGFTWYWDGIEIVPVILSFSTLVFSVMWLIDRKTT